MVLSSTHYKRETYKSILSEGIKCNYLLKRSWAGRYNGPYYISLAKVTIPDNITFLNYVNDERPSFIVEGIKPIQCKRDEAYLKYIDTKDNRRVGNFVGEYQYYYWIKKQHIKGLVYNLYNYTHYKLYSGRRKIYIETLLELISLLTELNIDIPIYDYSRRDKILVHEINKEKLKYYSKTLL